MTPGHTATTAATPARRRRLHQCGVSLRVDAERLLRSGASARRIHGQATELVAGGTAVAVRIDVPARACALRYFHDICLGYRGAFHRAGVDPARLEVTIAAGSMPLPAAWQIRRTLLGRATLNVSFDACHGDDAERRPYGDVFWHDLWRLRDAPVRTAFWPTVRSACALLSAEHAGVVVPGCGLQAPEQSAWLRAEIDVAAFADDDGNVDMPALESDVAHVVNEADGAYAVATWTTSQLEHDAWFNRRLAIVPVGLGDVAAKRGLDPERHLSLAAMRRLVAGIRRAVMKQSRQRATGQQQLPSIAAGNPCLRLPAGVRESGWQHQWRAAIERHALGHRNLLVLSPWSLFPRGTADFRYANFLPLLAEADACEFRRQLSLAPWTARQMKLFHCRARALNDTA